MVIHKRTLKGCACMQGPVIGVVFKCGRRCVLIVLKGFVYLDVAYATCVLNKGRSRTCAKIGEHLICH